KFEEVILQKTNGKGINVIFDAIGGKSVKLGIRSLSAGGRIVCYGASEMIGSNSMFHYLKTGIDFGFYNPGLLTMAAKSIIGVNILRISDERPELLKNSMDEVCKLAEQGIFKPVLWEIFTAFD